MYHTIFSLENIYYAWLKYKRGKRKKFDVAKFERHLEDNIFDLYDDLKIGQYKHGPYQFFSVFDTKKRGIHKASVRDRVVHQILFDFLCKIYVSKFIKDSYASIKYKGLHRAVKRLKKFIGEVLSKKPKTCFVLKIDVRQFFVSVNHKVLKMQIQRFVKDQNILNLLTNLIDSFHTTLGKGIPLGNITSQIFANIYLHDLDIYAKEKLGLERYVRYNDDITAVFSSKKKAEAAFILLKNFARKNLLLEIPEEKMSIRKARWGIDFLGYIVKPKAIMIRPKTKTKIINLINPTNADSYFGFLKHAQTFNLKRRVFLKLKDYYLKDDILKTN